MARLHAPHAAGRNLPTYFSGAMLALLSVLVLRAVLLPDPALSYFLKGQRLEAAGLLQLALRHYVLVSETHPQSPYAPPALQRQADILTGLARRSGDGKTLRQAVGTYLRLADHYPENQLAGDALLTAGAIAFNDLSDAGLAKSTYRTLLARYPNNRQYAAAATLRLGRVAIIQGAGKTAQLLLQKVLQNYSVLTETCAEAQYHLGVAYETLFKNKEWAKNAYEATFKRYPQSVWAGSARERLGMLLYPEVAALRQTRRVLIEVAPLPDDASDGSLFAALRPLLASRSIEVDATTLQGWSLEPFFAGFDPASPARMEAAPFDDFDNAVANAGLRYSVSYGQDEKSALRGLQDELDAARAPLVFDGRWALAVGYDSAHNQVLLQDHGARFDTTAVKEFSGAWKQQSPLGGRFTMLSFFAPGDRPTVKPTPAPVTGSEPTATPAATAAAQPPRTNPGVAGLAPTAPSFVFTLKPLSARLAHRRALRRAAQWMRRPRQGATLLNLEALDALAHELARLAIRAAAPLPRSEGVTPDANSGGTDESPARLDDPESGPAAPTVTPAAVAAPAPDPPPQAATRVRALLGWFKGPLQQWVGARRDAAFYLDAAATALNDPALRRAADAFRRSVQSLESAAAQLPVSSALTGDDADLTEDARHRLEAAGRDVAAAHDAELQAVVEMESVQ